MRDEVIYFMDMVPSGETDAHGDPVLKNELSVPIYSEKKSIGKKEFYQAQTSGMKPELIFVITDHMDYQGQKYLVHDGIMYKILKTYQSTKSNELEITCYGGVRNANAAIGYKDN